MVFYGELNVRYKDISISACAPKTQGRIVLLYLPKDIGDFGKHPMEGTALHGLLGIRTHKRGRFALQQG
jgi:hypothetical protein